MYLLIVEIIIFVTGYEPQLIKLLQLLLYADSVPHGVSMYSVHVHDIISSMLSVYTTNTLSSSMKTRLVKQTPTTPCTTLAGLTSPQKP